VEEWISELFLFESIPYFIVTLRSSHVKPNFEWIGGFQCARYLNLELSLFSKISGEVLPNMNQLAVKIH
jgi:hypothetical protein